MLLACAKLFLLLYVFPPGEPGPVQNCYAERYEGAGYTICRFDQAEPGLSFHLYDEAGDPFGDFTALENALTVKGKSLVFAMNGGMYHEDRAPVGLYIEEREKLAPIQLSSGYGNFHLLPNGVFYVDDDGAHVLSGEAYKAAHLTPRYATQSGPMLVIDGELHPAFREDSVSYKRRNGVGVDEETGTLYFVLSDGFVTFHRFASLFRDHLHTENALYLDGTISRLYAAELNRNDPGAAMGPIIAITSDASAKGEE